MQSCQPYCYGSPHSSQGGGYPRTREQAELVSQEPENRQDKRHLSLQKDGYWGWDEARWWDPTPGRVRAPAAPSCPHAMPPAGGGARIYCHTNPTGPYTWPPAAPHPRSNTRGCGRGRVPSTPVLRAEGLRRARQGKKGPSHLGRRVTMATAESGPRRKGGACRVHAGGRASAVRAAAAPPALAWVESQRPFPGPRSASNSREPSFLPAHPRRSWELGAAP